MESRQPVIQVFRAIGVDTLSFGSDPWVARQKGDGTHGIQVLERLGGTKEEAVSRYRKFNRRTVDWPVEEITVHGFYPW